MTRRKRYSLVLFSAICVGSMAVVLVEQNCACAFENLRQAQTKLTLVGFHCVSDREDGGIDYSFVVSRTVVTRAEVVAMRKTGAMGAEWRGRVWVVAPSAEAVLATTPGDMPPRVWGRLWAFGDAELLDEIEQRRLGRRFCGLVD